LNDRIPLLACAPRVLPRSGELSDCQSHPSALTPCSMLGKNLTPALLPPKLRDLRPKREGSRKGADSPFLLIGKGARG
jgi:hypothetical protein